MVASYSDEKCIPCTIDTPALKGEAINDLMKELDDAWELIEDKKISKKFKFKNFKQALDFVNKVGEIAEKKGHHPDIELGWGRVKITLMTHKIQGLSKNDFILASLIDEI